MLDVRLLVHVMPGMERWLSYKPRHDKNTSKTFVKSCPGKYLHDYLYFILVASSTSLDSWFLVPGSRFVVHEPVTGSSADGLRRIQFSRIPWYN